jgi:hypothetical protein
VLEELEALALPAILPRKWLTEGWLREERLRPEAASSASSVLEPPPEALRPLAHGIANTSARRRDRAGDRGPMGPTSLPPQPGLAWPTKVGAYSGSEPWLAPPSAGPFVCCFSRATS